MSAFLRLLLPVLVVLLACSPTSDHPGDPGPTEPDPPGPQDPPPGLWPACVEPTDLVDAFLTQVEARACWSFIDAQADALPRQPVPDFWACKYFDVRRFNVGGDYRTDRTAETLAYAQQQLIDHPWINFASLPPIGPPWATPFEDIYWPYTEDVLAEKLRSVAVSMLLVREMGQASRVTIMMEPGWDEGFELASAEDFRTWVDDVLVPQVHAYAVMAERIHSEYFLPLGEVDRLFQNQPVLRRLPTAQQLALMQECIDKLTAASTVFTGPLVSGLTALWFPEAAARQFIDPQMNVPDWSQLDFSAYDECMFTMAANCAPDGEEYSSIVTVAEQIARIESFLSRHPTIGWSIGELQPPYDICGADRPASIQSFLDQIDQMDRQPIGLGMDSAPIDNPAADLEPESIAIMEQWVLQRLGQ